MRNLGGNRVNEYWNKAHADHQMHTKDHEERITEAVQRKKGNRLFDFFRKPAVQLIGFFFLLVLTILLLRWLL
ncbi:MAG: hypothetical protein RBR75_03090 [Acholeplasmataceae bacterium]|jgi:hypothetical protein|nr:hypothetical protein [Acholeplasmataceae bacterium]